ncbi:neutral/alkaline non-lysosomal ceramidase N-terminal domain-containing protein [Solimonas flava]|uniref:neutral/alkaline non-lysosomal ceramidase N-terminal domain-containing protein n=1 Tax=Solimonas flava TaxID=415849 RepID=UPI0003F60E14|nr:neutral/alkaline non-lysosomal ceramidase N-terminal domain-containing protein [Solimonas flava]
MSLLALVAACGRASHDAQGEASATMLPAAAQCVLDSPALAVGSTPDLVVNGVAYTDSHQPDAPGPLETPRQNVGAQPDDGCRGNEGFRFGSGLYDVTGPIGGDATGHADLAGMVLPPQAQNGIHTRLYARAFAIASPCNGKRVVFVSDDHAFVTALEHQEVMKAIAADPLLSQYYGPDNVMISATHTHSAPGGYGDETVLPNLPAGTPQFINDVYNYVQSLVLSTSPYDADNFKVMVDGIVQAIRRAHANLEAHPASAPIRMSIGELLNANRSRDPPAYMQNSPAERAQYVDADGHEVDVDKRFLQLSLVRGNGSAAGVINWFGVHPTTMGNHELLISSDSKGWAGLSFERMMGTRYVPDTESGPDGSDNFVAAFAQSDEGNSIPDLFVFDKDMDGKDGPGQGVPYRFRHGTDDPYDLDQPGYALGMQKATVLSGTKQLAQALKQYAQGSALSGPVDYRFFYVDMTAITVDDPALATSLNYPDLPASLYADEPKRTCAGAVGVSKLAGGANAPDLGAAGYACANVAPVPYWDAVRHHYNGIFNGTQSVIADLDVVRPLTIPFPGVLAYDILTPLLCATEAQLPQNDCQAEKPPLAPATTTPAPIQILRIGNLAILGIPWETTTMAGRRLRQTVLDALAPAGVDTVVIAGLANAYFDYMATREEYTAQLYEGASTYFGPWQLAAVQQEARRLALTMAAGEPAPEGIAPDALAPGDASPVTIDTNAEFGKIASDAQASYAQGDTVDVSFVAGYPGNDLRTMASYLYVERQDAAGGWTVVATDKDPELSFVWHGKPDPVSRLLHVSAGSTAEAIWRVPANTAAGTYRIRHVGVSRASADAAPVPYEGVSRSFAIEGTPARCP